MHHSYSSLFENSGVGWVHPLVAALADVKKGIWSGGAGGKLSLYRILCLATAAQLVAVGTFHRLFGAGGVNPFWPEALLALAAVATIVLSYRSRWVQHWFLRFVQSFCYLTTGWFVVLAMLNQFAVDHAIGLLFIIPAVGAGYSVSLNRVRPLVVYFAGALAATALALAYVPEPDVAVGLFAGALLCVSCVTFTVAHARLNAQKRFLDSEERYRAVVEQASDGICLLDASTLRFLDANASYQRMVGLTLAELKQRTLGDLVVLDHTDSWGRSHAFLNGRKTYLTERRLRRKDGTTLCVELHVDRITYGGREVLSVVVHDVSLRKQYEASLVAAKEHAEAIARFKSSMLANMSHEIRTPLCSILGWSSVLADEVGAPHRELVALIEQSGKRLHRTLDAVLELAHLDANGRQVTPTVVDVAAEVADALEPYRLMAAHKGLDLWFVPPPNPVWANVDASCLRRILTHLVDNAVKFTETGGISVAVEAEEGTLRLRVRDTGIGIGEAFLPHLFEEFKQESEGLTRAHDGNGLGLAITRRLVDLLQGQIHVETKKGVGSCFTVSLPGVLVAGKPTRFGMAAA